jgi:hypothetical protein
LGASNALAAYAKYAGRVPPLSLQCLVYMALVSKDTDPRPWYGQGHQALAEHALGRPVPVSGADIRAVERAMSPLLEAGAIVTDRRASVRRDGSNTARYRLILDPSAEVHAPRKPSGVKPVEDPQRPTVSGTHARRFPDSRPTVSGTHARRKPSDIGDTRRHEEREDQEQEQDLRTAVTVPRDEAATIHPHPSLLTGNARASPKSRCDRHPVMAAGADHTGRLACPLCRAQGRLAPTGSDG